MPFSGLHLHANLLKGVRELGFTRPTPVQLEAIPAGVAGHDVLACAQTGSGKTAAFLLPILHRLMDRPRRTTRALILTPTRELAAQILEDFNALAVHTPLTGAAVYGGVSMGPQEHAFRTGVDIMVATPGRLLDHARAPYAKLSGVEYLVLDEADRMLDMGFLPDVRRILRHIPERRQTLFFSATMPPPIAALASEMLKRPVTINLQRKSAPAVGITQAAYPVPQHLKATLLATLLKRGILTQALVFTRTKHRANRLTEHLVREGVAAERIHGNRSQGQRTQALAGFKSGRYPVLVATDIAARGIDVEALSHVVNFDVPKAPEDYVHRVGRTGRAEATGEAFTFFAPDEDADLRGIERALGVALPRVTLPDFDYRGQKQPPLEIPRGERIAAIRARRARESGQGRRTPERKETGRPGGRQARPERQGSGRQGPARPAEGAPPRDASGSPRPGGGPPGRRRFGPRRTRRR
jgi:ATP-dependent RNA helicase RhlE